MPQSVAESSARLLTVAAPPVNSPRDSTVRFPKTFRFGPFLLQPERQLLLRMHKPVQVGGRAFDLLIRLAERAGEVVSKKELMACAWPDTCVDEANLKVNIASLRRVLGESADAPRFIATVKGRGYRFVAPVDAYGLVVSSPNFGACETEAMIAESEQLTLLHLLDSSQ